MPEDMRHLKQFASSRLSSFKGYLSQKDFRPPSPSLRGAPTADSATRPSWTQWAGDKLKRRPQGQDPESGVEKMILFPGWAARRFHRSAEGATEPHFDAEIFVSGFASRLNSPDTMSRSQRAFLRLAKGFASLPKLQASPANVANALAHPESVPLSKSTEDLLASVHLPPPPSEMSEAAEARALEEQFRKLHNEDEQASTGIPRSPSMSSLASSESSPPTTPPATPQSSSMIANLHELHANLEARLQPFWSSAIANRCVRLSLYTSEECASIATAHSTQRDGYKDPSVQPILTREVLTGPDGSFQANFFVPWDNLCTHESGVQIAFAELSTEHNFFILAELLPKPPPPTTPTAPQQVYTPFNPTPVFGTSIKVPLTFAPIRVISDIDDTVKMANVMSGARAVFNTVFVQRLSDIIIPGMGQWYTDLWEQGVRFHYVSNGPFEILPVLNEFFQVARLPPGSIRLRSYGGRSLFNGLLSAPAVRKRQGVVDILDSFPESQFILIGDSGEQDLELYASIAAERSRQVLAVFIRDVRGRDAEPLEDPTGIKVALGKKAAPPSPTTLRSGSHSRSSRTHSMSKSSNGSLKSLPGDYFSAQAVAYPTPKNAEPWGNGQIVEEPELASTPGGSKSKPTDAEWKRFELQNRVDKARAEIPEHIPFRVFRNPEDCVECKQIVEKTSKAPPERQDKTGILIDI